MNWRACTFIKLQHGCAAENTMTNKNWITAEVDSKVVDQLQKGCCIPRAVATCLAARHIDSPESAIAFLDVRLQTLRDPFEFPEMEKAVSRILGAIQQNEPVVVHGDYDVDGVSSSALLVRVLHAFGANAYPILPSRFDEGYGFSSATLDRACEQHHPSLIITVDCGTGSVETVEEATRRGIDVIITDHHEVGSEAAKALALINPKATGPADLSYLAGVGVTFKLCHALVKRAREQGVPGSAMDLREHLDLVALGSICDVVPLIEENRILARHGLEKLGCTQKTGLKALCKKAAVTPPCTTYHAGFVLGPRLNAAGRLGDAEASLELLLTDDPARAEELAAHLETSNRERQAIEKETVEAAIENLQQVYKQPDSEYGLIAAGQGWHEGVVGIVASRICKTYGRPAIVISLDGEGGAKGSCRSIDALNIVETLKECGDLLQTWGGHAMAAGLSLHEKDLEAFRSCFAKVVQTKLEHQDLSPVIEIDAWVQPEEVNDLLWDAQEQLEPFGLGNKTPCWALRGAELAGKAKIMKEKHLRLSVKTPSGDLKAVGFNMADQWEDVEGPIDLAFRLRRNEWKGRSSLELHLVDFRAAE